jgi:hypothetical protein
MMPRKNLLWSLLLVVWSCGEVEYKSFPIAEGGICSSQSASQCIDEDHLLACVAREWTVQSCTETCAELGFSPLGCNAGGNLEWCQCEQPDDPCAATPSACASAETVYVCEDGETTILDCGELCAASDPPRISLGCDDSGWTPWCECTLEGSPCVEQPPRCDDPARLASCVDGTWVVEECPAACDAEQVGICTSVISEQGLLASCSCVSDD